MFWNFSLKLEIKIRHLEFTSQAEFLRVAFLFEIKEL